MIIAMKRLNLMQVVFTVLILAISGVLVLNRPKSNNLSSSAFQTQDSSSQPTSDLSVKSANEALIQQQAAAGKAVQAQAEADKAAQQQTAADSALAKSKQELIDAQNIAQQNQASYNRAEQQYQNYQQQYQNYSNSSSENAGNNPSSSSTVDCTAFYSQMSKLNAEQSQINNYVPNFSGTYGSPPGGSTNAYAAYWANVAPEQTIITNDINALPSEYPGCY